MGQGAEAAYLDFVALGEGEVDQTLRQTDYVFLEEGENQGVEFRELGEVCLGKVAAEELQVGHAWGEALQEVILDPHIGVQEGQSGAALDPSQEAVRDIVIIRTKPEGLEAGRKILDFEIITFGYP
jgi:hypothetical protein